MSSINKFEINGQEVLFDDSKLTELEQEVIYDVTANNNGVTFASLSELLSDENLSTIIPSTVRCGGMSIRFVESSDNKYVQYRLMSNAWSINVSNWQGVDDEPTAGSENLVKSGGVNKRITDETWKLQTSFTTTDEITYIIAAVDSNGYVGFGLRLDGKLKFFEEEIDFNSKLSASTIIQSILTAIESQSEVMRSSFNKDYSNFGVIDKEGFVGMLIDSLGLHVHNIINPATSFNIIDKDGYVALELNSNGELTYVPSDRMLQLYRDSMPIELAEPLIWTPDNIYVLQGTIIQIYKGSIAPLHNPENYELRIQRPSTMTSSDNFGANYDFCYQYEVNIDNPDFEMKFGLYSDLPNKVYWDSHKVKFVHVAKKSSPASMKNILCIGDSFTDAEYWPAELRRLLTGESSTYSDNREIAPSADNIINLNFIGTRDTGTNRTPNEGISGWNYQKFVTESTSPFVFNGEVDFNQYLSERDVHGSISDNIEKIDIAIIALNTNGGYNDTVCNAMYDALLSHNPNMKILVCGKTFGTPYGFPTNLVHGQTYVSLSRSLKDSEEFLQAKCLEDNYKNNLLYVDYHLQLDSFHNMRHNFVAPNNRNNAEYDKIKQGSDNVHPADIGYFQMADALHAAFHYWCL